MVLSQPPETQSPKNQSTEAQPTPTPDADTSFLPEPLQQYFDALNQHDFERAAAMYAAQGQIEPPFEKVVVGREAVEAHLKAEACDMRFYPLHYESVEDELIEDERVESVGDTYLVKGWVRTPMFKVNVAWTISLNEAEEIERVSIKLLADLKDLLKLIS